jgi:hypothetical protein
MNHFKFDHESSTIPALLTIEVSYTPYYREATYDSPSEFDADDVSYRVMCDKLDMTECIDNSNFRELHDEIETAVNTEISNHFFNL